MARREDEGGDKDGREGRKLKKWVLSGWCRSYGCLIGLGKANACLWSYDRERENDSENRNFGKMMYRIGHVYFKQVLIWRQNLNFENHRGIDIIFAKNMRS